MVGIEPIEVDIVDCDASAQRLAHPVRCVLVVSVTATCAH
jgi:hypothetical protein